MTWRASLDEGHTWQPLDVAGEQPTLQEIATQYGQAGKTVVVRLGVVAYDGHVHDMGRTETITRP